MDKIQKYKKLAKMKRDKQMVDVELDIDNDVLLALALEAHKRDMKLNDLFVEILERKIASMKWRKELEDWYDEQEDKDLDELRDDYNRHVEY